MVTPRTIPEVLILIQHDNVTGRYHPAHYRLEPFPGGVVSPARYKSRGHHTQGFADLASAQADTEALAYALGIDVPAQGFDVREMSEAGVDLFLSALRSAATAEEGKDKS